MFSLGQQGGQEVGPGNYWNLLTGERAQFEATGVLPMVEAGKYYRIPTGLMLLAAPLMGFAYALFLPFIGIAMMFAAIGQKIFGGLGDSLWHAASFGWQPSEAYLAGKKTEKKEDNGNKEETPEEDNNKDV